MSPPSAVGLPQALERAAAALPGDAGKIRPANGDPLRLHRLLGAEAATRVLQWLLANEPLDAAELVRAWTEDPGIDPTPVLALDEGALPKAGKKTLRRALHRLRSRGVTIGERAPEKVVATLGSVEDGLCAAVLTPIDPRGGRAAYLALDNPAGGARVFEVMLDEERGIVGFEVFSAGRSKIRKFLRELTGRDPHPAVEATPDAVRALVARVSARQPSNRPPPRGFTEWRSRVAVAPEGSATPGELARQALGEVDSAGLDRAAELVRGGELGPWPPPLEALQPLVEEIAAIAQSDLVVSGPARRERVEGMLERGLGELFTAAFARCCSERFEEMAYVYWKWDREDDARACLAAADAFQERAPTEQPVARALLEVVLSPVLEKLGEDTYGEEASLLVKP